MCSYNIHGGADTDRRPSLGAIVETLRDINADVILLQEVDRFLPRSGWRNQAGGIAKALGMREHFHGRLRFALSAFGNATLTHAGQTARVHRLPLMADGGEPRGALGVTLESGLTIWNTHLGLQDRWRKTQLETLARALTLTDGPVVVGGDFNARLDEAEMAWFQNVAGLTCCSEDAFTFPAARPAARIDFLFTRGMPAPVERGTVAGIGSDHCLIWAEFPAAVLANRATA